MEDLAKTIDLDYKSVNKWLWDRKNRLELAAMERIDKSVSKIMNTSSPVKIFRIERVDREKSSKL